MSWMVAFFKDERELGSTPWSGSLESARRHAVDHFKIQQTQNGATRVEIRSFSGDIVFARPEKFDA